VANERRAKARAKDPPPKEPKAGQPKPLPQQDSPIFCFRYADRATKNAWNFDPSGDDACELLGFLCEMCLLTWAEIAGQQTGGWTSRHRKHHSIPVDVIESKAQDDLAQRKLGERFGGDIFRFRLGGTKRLWGFGSSARSMLFGGIRITWSMRPRRAERTLADAASLNTRLNTRRVRLQIRGR
jgi:hypothetical protein